MAKALVTGGSGFIGRWVVKRLLNDKHSVTVIDNLSNGRKENLFEFNNDKNFKFIMGDILNKNLIEDLFKEKFDVVLHLAAQINVQESIDNPRKDFNVNLNGTYNLLEEALRYRSKVVLVGTCMVYDIAINKPINEEHPLKPTSPYASSKLSAEILAKSYYYTYNLPIVVLRPFNTYGPYQKSNTEGGVVSVFLKRKLSGNDLQVFGDGNQTRDFLYVEDCADFITKAAFSDKAIGHVINAGFGKDVSINDLAFTIIGNKNKIKHIKHPHPKSEISKLLCDYSKATELLGWKPITSLKEGIKKTEKWLKNE